MLSSVVFGRLSCLMLTMQVSSVALDRFKMVLYTGASAPRPFTGVHALTQTTLKDTGCTIMDDGMSNGE